MPILLILCVKKCTAFLGLFWGLEGPGYFFILFQFLCIDFHNSSKAGTAGLGVPGAVFGM